MPNDFAMTTLDRLLTKRAERRSSAPAVDLALLSTLDRLIGEVSAINFKGTGSTPMSSPRARR